MNRSLYVVKAFLAVATLAYLGYVVDWSQIVQAAGEAHWGWIAAAVALLPLNLGVEAWRWFRFVQHVDPDVRFKDTLGSMFSGFALGFLTPLRVGDYAGRAFYLQHQNKWELAALTFAERMLSLACCIAFGLLALVYFLLVHLTLAPLMWWLILVTSVLCGCFLLFFLLHPHATYNTLILLLPWRRAQRHFSFLTRFSQQDMLLLLALSAARYLTFTTQFVFLMWAFAPSFPILHAFVGAALVFYAKSLIPSLTLAELGVREGVAIYFLGVLGMAEAAAFNAAFLLFGVNILLPALAGVPFIFRLRLQRFSARTAPQPGEAA